MVRLKAVLWEGKYVSIFDITETHERQTPGNTAMKQEIMTNLITFYLVFCDITDC